MERENDFQKEMNEKLEAGIKSVYNSEEWKNYLRLYSNFANYSFNNKILVLIQKPDAQIIKTYQSWKNQYGRTVNKGEKGIYIIQPSIHTKQYTVEKLTEMIEKNPESEYLKSLLDKALKNGGVYEEERRHFQFIPVFDVSQTSGKELPPHTIREALKGKVDNYAEVMKVLTEIALTNGYADSVSFKNPKEDDSLVNAYGYYRPSTKEIVLCDDMSEEMTVKVLVHEIAHSMIHGKEMFVEGIDNTTFISKKDIKEIQAESVAYVVCQDLGIDSAMESFGYVAEFANEDLDKLKDNLEIIDKTSKKLIEEFDKVYEKVNEKEEDYDDYE